MMRPGAPELREAARLLAQTGAGYDVSASGRGYMARCVTNVPATAWEALARYVSEAEASGADARTVDVLLVTADGVHLLVFSAAMTREPSPAGAPVWEVRAGLGTADAVAEMIEAIMFGRTGEVRAT